LGFAQSAFKTKREALAPFVRAKVCIDNAGYFKEEVLN
jgi:hypothetical protein